MVAIAMYEAWKKLISTTGPKSRWRELAKAKREEARRRRGVA
jgi:hypothetical protein